MRKGRGGWHRRIARVIKQIADFLDGLISKPPESNEPRSEEPSNSAKLIVRKAALSAAGIAGGLAIPPGIAGLVTVLPDLMSVVAIQKQMIADVAAAFGKSRSLGREEMMYCLFRHVAGNVVGSLVVEAGTRTSVRRIPLRAMQKLLRQVGLKITQRSVGKAIAKVVPVVAIAGMAGYAFWDTCRVGRTTIRFFSKDFEEPPLDT